MVIKLHGYSDGEEFLANTEKISCVRNYGTGSTITIDGYGIANVKENMTEIMQMMIEGYFKKEEGEQ